MFFDPLLRSQQKVSKKVFVHGSQHTNFVQFSLLNLTQRLVDVN